jgi:hypothetical protein
MLFLGEVDGGDEFFWPFDVSPVGSRRLLLRRRRFRG